MKHTGHKDRESEDPCQYGLYLVSAVAGILLSLGTLHGLGTIGCHYHIITLRAERIGYFQWCRGRGIPCQCKGIGSQIDIGCRDSGYGAGSFLNRSGTDGTHHSHDREYA